MNRKRVLVAVAALVALMAILGVVLRSRRNVTLARASLVQAQSLSYYTGVLDPSRVTL